MATKQIREAQPVEQLTGTLQGTRFKVVLDDIKIGDKWDPSTLPVIERDGLGKTILADGVTSFQFRDTSKSTVVFTPLGGRLEVASFLAEVVTA